MISSSAKEAVAGLEEPAADCALCPRLAEFREANGRAFPDYHNAPVPSFGAADVALLIVGLAPGLHGANRTGRPFTGDYAGDLLYPTLEAHGFTAGRYARSADDGFRLVGCRLTNAVRCVPPENKPVGAEVANCRRFLAAEIAGLPRLEGLLALGSLAHGATLSALGLVRSRYPFRHGAVHRLPNGLWLADSYHCSRYNTNTGRLTEAMFHAVVADLRTRLTAAA